MKATLILPLSVFLLSACAHTATTSPSPTPTSTPSPSPTVLSAEASPSARLITRDELATHTTPADCWLAIDGKVYDVSGFGDDKHPGGKAIYQGCGKDATVLYNTRPMGSGTSHSDKARSFLPNFYIGDLTQ